MRHDGVQVQFFGPAAVKSGKCPTELRKDSEASVGFGEASGPVAYNMGSSQYAAALYIRSGVGFTQHVYRSIDVSIDPSLHPEPIADRRSMCRSIV